MNQPQESNEFQRIALEIADTLARKNHDYGDSFSKVYEEFGDLSTFIRLSDKIGRLKTLMTHEAMVDESIIDVYRDIAGYAILTLHSIERINRGRASYANEEESQCFG